VIEADGGNTDGVDYRACRGAGAGVLKRLVASGILKGRSPLIDSVAATAWELVDDSRAAVIWPTSKIRSRSDMNVS